jgi:hypothetical protein
LSEDQRQAFAAELGRSQVAEPMHTLLAIATEDVRVLSTGQGGGIVQYTVAVPRELRNILVLDASHPIRKLVHLDRTIQDAETKLTHDKKLDVPFSKLKNFGDVTIKQMYAHGGRNSMSRDFSKLPTARSITKEIAEVVKTIPTDESVLVFVFKPTASDKVNYRSILLEDLERHGIDTMARDDNGRPRVNVLTWGQQTSLNNYAHCEHVVLGGVLHRGQVDLAAYYLSQTGDLKGRVRADKVKELVDSEITHVVYQALSRGSCRKIENGKAKTMTGYVIHSGSALRAELEPIMDGVNWQTWETKHGVANAAKIVKLASTIAEHLDGLPSSVSRISTTKLKKAMAYAGPPMTFTCAVRLISDYAAWALEGRSAVRIFPT